MTKSTVREKQLERKLYTVMFLTIRFLKMASYLVPTEIENKLML
jgi:hypothetical protein